MTTTTKKVKFCWVSKQTKNGYRLALDIGGKQYNLKGLVLKSEADVSAVLENGGIVFVHLASHKE